MMKQRKKSADALKLSHQQIPDVHQIVTKCLQMATEKNLNHLPDEIVQESIHQLKTAAAY